MRKSFGHRWTAKANRAAFAVLASSALLIAGATYASATASARTSPHAHTTAVSASTSTENMLVTLYGWDDNSPPGCATAYSGCAGGAGTYSAPTTFATDKSELAVGTLVYYAPLDRYFVMGDDCVECDEDWTGSGPDGGPDYRHIDLWAGGNNGDDSTALINCEDNWTSNGQVPVLVSPSSGEPVANSGNGGPMFVTSDSHCWQTGDNGGPSGGGGGGGGGFPSGYHQLVLDSNGLCVDDYANSTSNNTIIDQWKCRTSNTSNQEWEFHSVSGSYGELQNELSGKDLVVQTASKSEGAKIIQYTQNGTTNGLWEPIKQSDGSWQFKNDNSGMCVDATGDNSTEGVQFQQWDCKSPAAGTNQGFTTH